MVHTTQYNYKGTDYYFLFDVESGSLHNVDYVAFLCAKYNYENATHMQLADEIGFSDAEKDMIKHNHLVNLNNSIPLSELSVIDNTTHLSIAKNRQTVDKIKEFLSIDKENFES
jgi:hypothetical protein